MNAILDTSTVIVGQSGSGKTVTAKDQVGQLLAQNRHVAIIDPTGVWWGMRATPAGEPNQAQLYVFGGEHGDVAIRPTQGAAIARIILDQRVSAVVDLSAIDNSADWRMFVHDFVAELRKKPKGNFHLIVDEADEFAAERVADDVGFRLRENMVWIAKRGRVAGFVPTYITQRTAEIAKAVISQAQTVIAHQLIAPADRKAIDEYLKGHGSAEARKDVMASLAELKVGERWIYSPRLQLLERGRTPALATFDSSRTPEPGETIAQPRALAELDTSAIAAALAPPVVEFVPPDMDRDPLAVSTAIGLLTTAERRVAELEAENADLNRQCDAYEDAFGAIEQIISDCRRGKPAPPPSRLDDLGSVQDGRSTMSTDGPPSRGSHTRDASLSDNQATEGATSPASSGRSKASSAPETAIRGRKALDALVSVHPEALTEAQWATLAGYAKTGGTWGTYRSALRAAGHVEAVGGRWIATDAGVEASDVEAGHFPAPGAARAKAWADHISGVRKMVDVLVKRWPHFVTRDGLAADLNMAASGGTFGTYIGRLRAHGMLEQKGQRLRLSAEIMGEDTP